LAGITCLRRILPIGSLPAMCMPPPQPWNHDFFVNEFAPMAVCLQEDWLECFALLTGETVRPERERLYALSFHGE
jgi:hypothetical protein